MGKNAEGYFTVEAAMVLPIVLATIILIMYLFVFQYNRCLMEQDTGALAVRGVSLYAEDNEERIEQLRLQADALYQEKYIAWEGDEIELVIGRGKIEIQQAGRMRFPVSVIGYGNQLVETTAICENYIISPVSLIRSYRKITGGQ